jgi:hypothetical protein
MHPDVRFWHKADIPRRAINVLRHPGNGAMHAQKLASHVASGV